MRMIAVITNTENRKSKDIESPIEPVLRLAVSLLVIILCAVSKNAFYTACVIGIELLRTALMSPKSIRNILKRTLLPVIFTAVIMIPAVFLGTPGTFGTVTMKVFESVLVLSVLNEEVPWNEMTGALSRLHAPGLFVMTLDTAIRFLVVLGRYSDRLVEAVSLRRVGKKSWKNAGTGGVLGITWLKSQQMLRANAEAMACRCFDGTYRKSPGFDRTSKRMQHRRLTVNLLYCLLFLAAAAGFVYTQRMM